MVNRTSHVHSNCQLKTGALFSYVFTVLTLMESDANTYKFSLRSKSTHFTSPPVPPSPPPPNQIKPIYLMNAIIVLITCCNLSLCCNPSLRYLLSHMEHDPIKNLSVHKSIFTSSTTHQLLEYTTISEPSISYSACFINSSLEPKSPAGAGNVN